jgi:hypothetical protein
MANSASAGFGLSVKSMASAVQGGTAILAVLLHYQWLYGKSSHRQSTVCGMRNSAAFMH